MRTVLLILACLLMPVTALLGGCDGNDQASSKIHAAPYMNF